MKKTLYVSLFCLIAFYGQAQEFKKASDYLQFVNDIHKGIYQQVVIYHTKLETVAATKPQEAQRKVVIQKLKTANAQLKPSLGFKGDKRLQDSLLAYTRRTLQLFEKDVLLTQRLQDSTLRSYLYTQKFMSAKIKTTNSILEDEKNFVETLTQFATNYEVPTPKKANEEYTQLLTNKEVGNFYTNTYLILNKCRTQESLLAKAIEMRRKTEIEQYSKVLLQYVKESQKTMDTIVSYKQDKSVTDATRNLFKFYKDECENKVPTLLMFLTRGGHDQVKAKTDIGSNTKVNPNVNIEDHSLVANYGNTQNDLTLERTELNNKWQKASDDFLNKHLPNL